MGEWSSRVKSTIYRKSSRSEYRLGTEAGIARPSDLRQSIGEMRTLAPWAAVVVLGTGLGVESVRAQSLAEVAKKEKERRERKPDDESVPVIDDEALVRSRGERFSVTEGVSSPSTIGKEQSAVSGDIESDERVLTETEVREYRETWARVWPQRLAAAKQELELAEDAVFQCQSAAHFFFVPLAIDCEGVYERRAIAEYRLREVRRNRFNWELLLPERQRPPPQKP